MVHMEGSDILRRRVLDAGSGRVRSDRRLEIFGEGEWECVTIDIDPGVHPDYVGSLTDMRAFFPDGSLDAIWASHTLEHLYLFDLKSALAEFRRILKPDGFALVTCPDVGAVAAAIVTHGLDYTAYLSPAGPITLHDILYGHVLSIEAGATAMAHRTGLTADRLGNLSLESGFTETVVGAGPSFDLWAILCGRETDRSALQALLAGTDAAFLLVDA